MGNCHWVVLQGRCTPMTKDSLPDAEEKTLAHLLEQEYSSSSSALKNGVADPLQNPDNKFDKAKLKKLQLLIDQSKAFSQIISSSLLQTNKDDAEPAKKKQKISSDETTNSNSLDTYKQPKSLQNVTLKPHQLKGMNWLISLYENGLNGILADEMGLGKTVQTISLLCFLLEQGIQGPFLIVAPLSVVSNWTLELSTFAPSLTFIPYIGDKKHRQKLRRKSLKKFNVIVTSYEISLIDFPYLKNTSWSYLVVDEGHRLKNANCMLFTKLKALNVSNRILLTGTPLQNNLAELWSLLNFILPDVFHDFATFQNYFNFSEFESLRDENDDTANNEEFNSLISMEIKKALVDNLHTILQPFILRRLKEDVLSLPPKREYIIYSNLSPLQTLLYSKLLQPEQNFRKILISTFFPLFIQYNYPELDKYVTDFMDSKKSDEPKIPNKKIAKHFNKMEEHYTFLESQLKMKRISNPLMQLRQICDSPYHYFFPWNDDTKISQDLILNTSKLQSLDSIIPEILTKKPKEKILIFSQFKSSLDLLQTYFNEHPNIGNESKIFPVATAILTGSSSKEERDEAIETFTTDDDCKVFLLSTRAANLGLNLTVATTVILYDSDLNPMVDIQAIARVHRIGQTKPCIVYRLATLATIEEAIWERVIKKRVLEGIVIELGNFDGNSSKNEKLKSKKDSTLDSLLNFYSSKRPIHLGLNNYKDASQLISNLKSNILTVEEVKEITSSDLSKYDTGHKINEDDMPHIKLLSESDVTGQSGLDGVLG